jgi:glycosyltransferase involved in cell wall biosynthesis
VPRVTVIIPTYNWSSVLPYSIGSVLRQTFRDWELLVIGDGCTDDSAQVVQAINDPRVRWINLPKNTGHQSAPNNEGLRQARGELIAYLGHDDLWLPHHLALAVAASDGGADVSYAITELIAPTGEPPTFAPAEMDHVGPHHWIPPTSIVHRATASAKVGGWRNIVDVNEDPETDLWARMRSAGCRFHYIRRLTAVKFPALWRPDVYKHRRCDEQAAWSARIDNDPDFEAVELARMLTPVFHDARWNRSIPQLFLEFGHDIAARVKQRLTRAGLLRRPDRKAIIHTRRKRKGLGDMP